VLRGCLTTFLALCGAFAVGVALDGDPCDTEEGTGYWFVIGVLLLGAGSFRVANGRTRRAWIPWVAALTTVLIVGFGLSVLAMLRWVEACSN
jgi:F0F1-type ATP synthase assembly protein I